MATDSPPTFHIPKSGGKPGRSGPPGNSNAATFHESTVRRDVKLLSSRALDRRTEEARYVKAVRDDLLGDLGGEEALSKQERLLVDEAAFLALQLACINTWLAKQPTLVDRRKRTIHPVVTQRLSLVSALRTLLTDLGLKRRARDVDSLEAAVHAAQTAPEAPQSTHAPEPEKPEP